MKKQATSTRATRQQKATKAKPAARRTKKTHKRKTHKNGRTTLKPPPGPDLVALQAAAKIGGDKLFPEITYPYARAYLAAYALTGKWTLAAALAGVDQRSGLNWRTGTNGPGWNEADHTAFQAALPKAERLAGDLIEAELIRRAVEGVDEPVYQGGKLIGFIRKYSDRLLEMAAKGAMPEKFRERFEHTGAGGAPLYAFPPGFRGVDLGNDKKEDAGG